MYIDFRKINKNKIYNQIEKRTAKGILVVLKYQKKYSIHS